MRLPAIEAEQLRTFLTLRIENILVKYKTIYCFLDNDDSGRAPLEQIKRMASGLEVVDQSRPGCRASEVTKLKVKDYYEYQGYRLDFEIKGGKKNRLAINKELEICLDEYLNMTDHWQEK